jgi:hypothetical protein
MGRVCSISITDSTTPDQLDTFFVRTWSLNQKVTLEIDATQCRHVSLRKVLSMKKVLDEHRPHSKKYIQDSTVVVKTNFARRILQIGLSIIRTERPVYVRLAD